MESRHRTLQLRAALIQPASSAAVLARPLHGAAAVAALRGRLPEVAALDDRPQAGLVTRLRKDPTL